MKRTSSSFLAGCFAFISLFGAMVLAESNGSPFYDYSSEKPGNVHKFTVKDLPAPFASRSANNFPAPVTRPQGAMPKTLPGFKVDIFATELDEPRELRGAPNGDIFLAESSK